MCIFIEIKIILLFSSNCNLIYSRTITRSTIINILQPPYSLNTIIFLEPQSYISPTSSLISSERFSNVCGIGDLSIRAIVYKEVAGSRGGQVITLITTAVISYLMFL